MLRNVFLVPIKKIYNVLVPFFLLGESERMDRSRRSGPNALCLLSLRPAIAPQHQKNCLNPRLNLQTFRNVIKNVDERNGIIQTYRIAEIGLQSFDLELFDVRNVRHFSR